MIKKAGILGGGQLGRMLLQAAANYPVETYVLENDANCPAAHLCHHFVKGDITNYEDVYNFGKGLDAVTIEIERVNVEALERLHLEGISVYPHPAALRILRDKILQKEFYKNKKIPSSDFVITTNRNELNQHIEFLPAVHKIGLGGYDGKGVQVIRNAKDITLGFDVPSVLEKIVRIKKEIAVIVAIDNNSETRVYAPTDMVFDPQLNLLNYQLSPAELTEKLSSEIEAIAIKVASELKSPGIFAVELFVDVDDNVLVNETAPRVHNSGHHTIEGCYSSQFDMLWRIILNFPPGNPRHILPSALVNLVGEPGYAGNVFYEGLNDVLGIDNAFVHIYGKTQTKPGRKMGHVTVLSNDKKELQDKIAYIKSLLSVKSV